MSDWNVIIDGRGRSGTITYVEGQNRVRFDWELGGRDVVAIITGPSRQHWECDLEWAHGRRLEILERVAQEAIRVQAPMTRAEYTDDGTTIVLRKKHNFGP